MTPKGTSELNFASDTEARPNGMYLREYAAITLKVPNSGIDWLDDMIRQAKRDEFAGMALQGNLAHYGVGDITRPDYAEWSARSAYELADAMMKARGE